MRAFRAETLTELHDGLCRTIVHAPPEGLDVITSVDVQIHNTISECNSMAWTFDMKDLWLTPSRWTMMINQYLDPEELKAWLEVCASKIGVKGRGQALMRTRVVKPRGGPDQGNKESRRWGSCMISISYKAKPRPTLILHSRTSYLGYLSALDLSVAWMCARYLAQAMGIRVEDIAFVWYAESIQYHNFKSLAYLLNHPNKKERKSYRRILLKNKMTAEERELLESSPALQHSRKWLKKITDADAAGETLGDMTYNTYRRIRRRFHTEVFGYEYAQQFEGWSYYKKGDKIGEKKEFFPAYKPLPSTPVEKLDFSKLGLPLTGVNLIDMIDTDDWDDDED